MKIYQLYTDIFVVVDQGLTEDTSQEAAKLRSKQKLEDLKIRTERKKLYKKRAEKGLPLYEST